MINIKRACLYAALILGLWQSAMSPTYNPSLNITSSITDIKNKGLVKYTTTNAAVEDARFTLYGDGYFDLRNNFEHQFPSDSTGFETITHFNERYKKHGPIIRKKSTGSTGSGGGTNNKISLASGTNSKVGASWSPCNGIENYFMLIFENTSNMVDSGCVELYFHDSQLSLNLGGVLEYDWVDHDSKNSVTGSALYNAKVIWSFDNLSPGEQRVVYVPMTAKVKSGKFVNLGSKYNSDCDLNNNNGAQGVLDFNFLTSGSPHDPNVKLVEEECVQAYSPFPQTITYTIKFQNEGNAPAVNVILDDFIDLVYLDILTINFLDFEYPFTYSISGNHLRIFFNDINLPGLKQAYPKSYSYEETESYIKFQICTMPYLPLGEIMNQADITFDGQPPIKTNIAKVPIVEVCSTPLCNPMPITTDVEEKLRSEISVSPNPVKDVLHVHGIEEIDVNIEIYNSQGKLVESIGRINQDRPTIDLTDLTRGLYYINIRNKFLNITKKVIKI